MQEYALSSLVYVLEHADKHDGGEDEGGSEDVTPVSFDGDEHGADGVSKNFTEGDVELVQGDHVATHLSFDRLCDVDLEDGIRC